MFELIPVGDRLGLLVQFADCSCFPRVSIKCRLDTLVVSSEWQKKDLYHCGQVFVQSGSHISCLRLAITMY